MVAKFTQLQSDVGQLSGELTFETVIDLEGEGQQFINQAPANCRIDLSQVTYSSSVGVALLLSWLRTSRAAEKDLFFEGIPEKMLAVLKISNLQDIIPFK